MDKARAMLFQAKAPKFLWAEAVQTANFVRNILLVRGQKKTPFELFHGRKPSVNRLRVFGCTAFVHEQEETRKKLDYRATKGMFVGYSTTCKGWRVIIEPEVGEPYIEVSRDVRFDESELGQLPMCQENVEAADYRELHLGDAAAATPRETGGIGEPPASPSVTDPGAITLPQGADEHGSGDRENTPPVDTGGDWDNTPPVATSGDWDNTPPVATSGDHHQEHHDGGHLEDDTTGLEMGTGADSSAVDSGGGTSAAGLSDGADSGCSRRYPARVRRGASTPYDKYLFVKNADEPTYQETLERDDCHQWVEARRQEYASIAENDTFEWLDPKDVPAGQNVIDTKWAHKLKRDEMRRPVRYKARLVAKGFRQIAGQDFGETRAPVSRHSTLRVLLAIVASEDLELEQVDITTAFLNGELEEEIYVKPPEEVETNGRIWRLRKALYGLKQAAKAWHDTLKKTLFTAGFSQSHGDESLFVLRSKGSKPVLVLVYVDDLLIAGDSRQVESVKKVIQAAYKCRDLGPAKHFLGMSIRRDRVSRELWLGQPTYTQEILARFGVSGGRPKRIHLDVNVKYSAFGEEADKEEAGRYPELVGCLLYLAGCTRPDLAHSVGILSRFCANPMKDHIDAGKQILRYLAGTSDLGLLFSSGENELVGYSDADFAGDPDKRRSTSGYVFVLNNTAVSWCSKIQATVAASTCEAEFIAASFAGKEALWLSEIVAEYKGSVEPVIMNVDNQGAVSLLHHPHGHQRTKHIDVSYKWIQDKVQKGQLKIIYCPTSQMVADCTTKAVPSSKYSENRRDMGLVAKKIDD